MTTDEANDAAPSGAEPAPARSNDVTPRDVLARLYAVRRAVRFYPAHHPSVQQPVAALRTAIGALLKQSGSDRLAFSFFDGEIMLDERLLVDESIHFDQLARELSALGIGSLALQPGIDQAELTRAVEVMAKDRDEIDRAGGPAAAGRSAELTHIELGEVRAFDRFAAEGEPAEVARAAYNGALALMREIDGAIRANEMLVARSIKQSVNALVDSTLINRSAMMQLTGLRSFDEYTFFHSANVAVLSLGIGAKITDDERFLTALGTGALLHDIGKLAIDADVLNKPGALSASEWAHMREHPMRGAQIAAATPGIDRSSLVTILEHHMRYDGTGYPTRPKPRSQHLASRIVAVADAYDAMTSNRVYSAARRQDEAVSLLADSAGSGLDPSIVRLFVRVVGVYPPRAVVRLDDESVAIVLEANESTPARPVVRVIAAADGSVIEPTDVDLAREPGLAIVGCVEPSQVSVDVEDFL